MSGNANKTRQRRLSFGLSHTSYGYFRRTSHYAADVEQVAASSLSLQRSLSQATTLWPRRDRVFSNDEAPLDSLASPYPSEATPAVPEQSPAQLNPKRPDHNEHLNAARRHSLPDIDTPLERKSSFKQLIEKQFFPRIIDSGTEPGQFYRKKAGQRCASAIQSELFETPGQAGIASPMGVSKPTEAHEAANHRSALSNLGQAPAEQALRRQRFYPTVQELAYMSSQQQAAWGIAGSINHDYQDASSPMPELATGDQPHYLAPIEHPDWDNTPSHEHASKTPVSIKVPLSIPHCVICASRPSMIMAETGAFCTPCRMAARQAGRSITTASNDDDCGSESLVDTVTTENTRRNRRVSFELPCWSSDGSSELDATEASCVLCGQIPGIIHGNAGGLCQRCWRETMNAERAARIIRANEEP